MDKKIKEKRPGAEELRTEFANLAGILASRLNISPIVGKIYALLYISGRPVSLNEMVEILGISKASASLNIRYLESWGAVKKVWVDSSRKDYYGANPDILSIVLERLRSGIEKRFEEVRPRFEELEKKLSADENYSKELKAKMEEMRGYYELAKFFMDKLFDKGKIETILKKNGKK